MKEMLRVTAPVLMLNENFQPEGHYSGSTLPYILDQLKRMPEGDATHRQVAYHLTVIDGKLYYLHEDAKSAPLIPNP